MLKMSSLDETISVYYDEQMKEAELLNHEARMALSDCVRDYTNEKCFEFYKISTSINKVRKRLLKFAKYEFKMEKIKFKKSFLCYLKLKLNKYFSKNLIE